MITVDDFCNLCGKGATLMCQRCNDTYCSTNCQILDWRVHKKVCFQMPNLVPIKESGNKEINSIANRSIGSDSPHTRTQIENRNVKRPLPRNPLKTTRDESSPSQAVNGKSPEINTIKLNHETIDFTLRPKLASKENEVSMKSNNSQCSKVTTDNAAWRTLYHYPEGVFFDVIVQCIEEGSSGIVWVTELKYDGPLRKLLVEINRNIDFNTIRCGTDEIQVGSLIAAPFEHIYYRAQIIEINQISKTAVVHLIDYGNLVEVAFKDLRSPIPIMRNLNAYAFRIRLAKRLAIETVLTIRVIDIEDNGVAIIEEKTTSANAIPSIGLTVEAFETGPSVSLVKISDSGKYALLSLTSEEVMYQLKEMNEYLNTDTSTQLSLEKPPKNGDYVVSLTVHGWARALVMCIYRNDYLVYLFDVGRVALVEQLLNVPEKFKSIPMQVFAVQLQTILPEKKSFKDCLFNDKAFTIKALKNTETCNGRIPCCILTSDGTNVANVDAFNYVGISDEIGVTDWVEPLISGSVVYISSVVSHFEVFISLVCTKMYPKIFCAVAEDCELLATGQCGKGDIVLAEIEGEYFRAKILECDKSDNVKVFNVDTGVESTVSSKTLRKPNIFALSCPYHMRKVQLLYLANVATPYADNKALSLLEQCQLKGAEFFIKFNSNPELGVELLRKTPDQQSLNKQLLPMLFEKSKDSVDENENLCPSTTPQPSPKVAEKEKSNKIYTLKDVEIIPITCGDNVPVMVLDSSTISKGYITGCDFTNTDFNRKLDSEYLPMVAKHCASLTSQAGGYCPSVDEICLAVFDVDKEWYRAVCLSRMKDDIFFVMFLDYGNMSRVHKNNIMQITPDLMFPSNANMCFFEGVSEELPPNICKKFISAIQMDPKVISCVTKLEQDSYLLKIKNKEKYF